MSREGVKPACCQKACCDWKDMLQDLYEKTINSYRILNGLYPDGTGELRITAGDGIIIDTLSGNEVRISADELAGYSAIAPIQLDTDLNTISIAIDDAPTLNSTNAVRSGGTYAAIRARGSVDDPVEEAAHAVQADDALNATYATSANHQTTADSQTTAGSATNANHQTAADSATNANHQTSAGEAAKLSTARDINIQDADGSHTGTAAAFDGTAAATIKLPATIKADLAGNADTATSATSAGTAASASEAAKLSTARSIKTDLASGTAASFDGSGDVTPGVTGILPITNGGTGNNGTVTRVSIPASDFQADSGNIFLEKRGMFRTLIIWGLTYSSQGYKDLSTVEIPAQDLPPDYYAQSLSQLNAGTAAGTIYRYPSPVPVIQIYCPTANVPLYGSMSWMVRS